MKEKHIKLSRFLSFVLRHKPEEIGLTLDDQGYLEVDKLIEGINNSDRYIDEMILDEIVNSDSKGRYSYNDDKSKIRANQGHSIPVDLNMKISVPPSYLFHGTADKYAEHIITEGLFKQKRNHVHLSDNLLTAIEVGKRHGEPIVFLVDAKKMYEDGCNFYLSENNVWLVDSVNKKYLTLINISKYKAKKMKEQEHKMWKSVDTARFIYNWTLERQEENYKNGGKFITDNDLKRYKEEKQYEI